jgi:hypothetical protein
MAKAILPALNRHFFPVREPRHVQVDGVLASPGAQRDFQRRGHRFA